MFSLIVISPENFDINDWIKDFSKFSKIYKKLLYSKISGKIISCEDNTVIENLTNNLLKIIELIKPKEKGEKKKGSLILVDKDCYTLFLKFYDHCNLAITQRAVYLKTGNEFKEIASATKSDVTRALDAATKKINKVEKNISTQLISLVSIFTALSFVIFGGISVFDNLLQNVRTLPVIKILLVSNLWFICMSNLFILFTKFICIMIGKPFKWINVVKILNAILLGVLAIIIFSGKCIYGLVFFL